MDNILVYYHRWDPGTYKNLTNGKNVIEYNFKRILDENQIDKKIRGHRVGLTFCYKFSSELPPHKISRECPPFLQTTLDSFEIIRLDRSNGESLQTPLFPGP